MRTTIAAAVALASVSLVGPAWAQSTGFVANGPFIVSAERLIGLHFWSARSEADATPMNPAPDVLTNSGTSLNLLWGSNSSVVNNVDGIYSTPRIAFDYAFSNFTFGGSLGFLTRGGTTENRANPQNVTTSQDLPSSTAFIIAPRGGYIFSFDSTFALWARLGVTYYTMSRKSLNPMGMIIETHTDTFSGLALSLDPQLVITPVPHFGITLGPILDFPLAGGFKHEETGGPVTTSTTSSYRVRNFGITGGILGHF